MSTSKTLDPSTDIKTSDSQLNQLVDFIQTDVSSSNSRKSYQVFVTGGIGPGVTSSLFQTVYDQDFSLQTSNPCFDITCMIFSGSGVVTGSKTGEDSTGKMLFPSTSIMMREKIENYNQYAQLLLGNAGSPFYSPYGSSTLSDRINVGIAFNIKRLFHRDAIKRESFAMRFYRSAAYSSNSPVNPVMRQNLWVTSESGSCVITDLGSSTAMASSVGGAVGNLVNSANTSENLGLIFYDQGIILLDAEKTMSGSEHATGSIQAVSAQTVDGAAGRTVLGEILSTSGKKGNRQAKFIPDFFVSASIDQVVDHIAEARVSSGSLTFMTFQNITQIKSTLIFCRATADEFNYSSNPTYVDPSNNKIRVIETGQEGSQKAFSYITTIGLYDANDNLLAVAKTSRPIEKNDEKDLTIRVRLDF